MPDETGVSVHRRVTFDAPRPGGRMHPYVLEVSVTGRPDARGFVIDFADLEALMRAAIGRLTFPAPAERLVVECWRDLEPLLRPRRLVRVTLWETPNQGAEYHGD